LMSGDDWEFRFFPDDGIRNLVAMAKYLMSCDLVYQIGGRLTLGKFLRIAKLLGKKRVIVHWCGSDVISARRELTQGKAVPWVTQKLHHWGDSEHITREVKAMGLSCEANIPLPSLSIPDSPCRLPSEFSVLVYVPDANRGELYGLDSILDVARRLPQVPFDLVGLKRGTIPSPPPNLRIHGHIPLAEFYRRAVVVWRPVRHDGLSFMVLEALGYGRHVLWTYPFPGCLHVTCAEEARHQIARLHRLHEQGQLGINEDGAQVIAEKYVPQFVKKQILGHLERILGPESFGLSSSSDAFS
jgi:hypothetical protein